MKLTKKLAPLMTAGAMVVSVFVVPAAQAEVSASVAIANMYLWRGVNEGAGSGAPQVSGELRGTSGNVYYGTWVSSSSFGGSETDLFVGYSGKAGELEYDISYWNYLYPEDAVVIPPATVKDGLMDTNQEEIVGSVSQGPFSVALYINVDGDTPDDNYLTVSYAWGKYIATYGMWMLESTTPARDEYSHITISYAATDALTFTVSKAFADLSVGGVEEDPLVQVSYAWNFDLKK